MRALQRKRATCSPKGTGEEKMRAKPEGPGRLRLKGTQSYISSQRLSLQKHPRNICSLDSFPSAFMLKRNRADAAVMPSFLIGKQTQTLL